MDNKELRELEEWCGKTFNLPFAVDEWILSTDGGKSCWSSEHRSKREAEERLKQFRHEFPNSPYCNSTVHHWQFYGRVTQNPHAVMEVQRQCIQRLPLHLEISFSEGMWWVSRPDADSTEAVMAETLDLAICQFAKLLFSNLQPAT